jgi:hypothetical protein
MKQHIKQRPRYTLPETKAILQEERDKPQPNRIQELESNCGNHLIFFVNYKKGLMEHDEVYEEAQNLRADANTIY